jgi:alkanesulfonate monooxygenase SsuD/methylene tetrahydromethanopterin reductase-like flavin-dependent oxidoreductase (luciferase family)
MDFRATILAPRALLDVQRHPGGTADQPKPAPTIVDERRQSLVHSPRGRARYNLLLDQFAAFDVIADRIALFKAERAERGRAYNPMGIALARDMHVADNQATKDAALERNRQFHERILSVARWPDRAGGSHILAYGHAPEEAEANSLIGTPDEIMGKLEALRRAGVEYVIMSCGGSRESLRRFAHEIMPAFSDEQSYYTSRSGLLTTTRKAT